MVSDVELKRILEENKTIAVVGMSRSTDKPARRIPAFLMTKGYNVVPVNPTADKILGRTSYPSLMDVPDSIDIVEVFRPSAEAGDIVRAAIERKKAKGDVKVIWLQQGITSAEGGRLAGEAGIAFVEDRCMYTEYVRLMKS